MKKDYSSTNPDAFVSSIKSLVKGVDTQYLASRTARKAVFEHEDVDYVDNKRCDVDLELWRCDEMVTWEKEEVFTGSAMVNGSLGLLFILDTRKVLLLMMI